MQLSALAQSRRWRRAVLASAVFISIVYIYLSGTGLWFSHRITATGIDLRGLGTVSQATGLTDVETATTLCRAHGFGVYPLRNRRRKVYDLFMVNDELDWLEIRMESLADEVDYFVIVEAANTFTAKAKPLVVKDNFARFSKFKHKIIHHVLDISSMYNKKRVRTWDYEDLQRNAMFDQVFPRLKEEQRPELGDVILVSDVDEIPRPLALRILRNCDFPRRLTLRTQFFYYSFQWRHQGPEWAHPQATFFEGFNKTIRPADLRNGEGGSFIANLRDKADLWNAGWHCSSCFETLAQMRNKLASFSHSGWNKPEFRKREKIVERVRNGKDLFDRPTELYDRVEDNRDVPLYVIQSEKNEKRFAYMMDRDPPNANFKDYVPGQEYPDD